MWLPQILSVMKRELIGNQDQDLLHGAVSIASSLLYQLPPSAKFGLQLFSGPAINEKYSVSISTEIIGKFACVFPASILTTLRGMKGNLIVSWHSDDYSTSSIHLARTFDLLSSFLMFLFLEDDEAVSLGFEPATSFFKGEVLSNILKGRHCCFICGH